jgi:hypothetical protein
MSISAASVNVDGTVATTGGTATTFISKDLTKGEYILDDSSEFLNQTEVVFTTKIPKVNASSPNGYTQARNQALLKKPLLLDNGDYTMNTGGVFLNVDHETTDAEIQSMLVLIAQLAHDPDFADFWKKQARS